MLHTAMSLNMSLLAYNPMPSVDVRPGRARRRRGGSVKTVHPVGIIRDRRPVSRMAVGRLREVLRIRS